MFNALSSARKAQRIAHAEDVGVGHGPVGRETRSRHEHPRRAAAGIGGEEAGAAHRHGGSRGELKFFFVHSSVYSCHLFLISSASVRSIPFLSFIKPIFARNVPLVSPIFLKIRSEERR